MSILIDYNTDSYHYFHLWMQKAYDDNSSELKTSISPTVGGEKGNLSFHPKWVISNFQNHCDEFLVLLESVCQK